MRRLLVILAAFLWRRAHGRAAALTLVFGILCGIAGAYLATALQAGFVKDMTAGRGFIALAALIFAKWRPVPALWACLLAILPGAGQAASADPAALETLAIVAYRQPVLRAEVEKIRGVDVGGSLRSLVERGLVKVVGRAEELGSPMLYGTTRRFLTVFGLKSLTDLPRAKDLRRS